MDKESRDISQPASQVFPKGGSDTHISVKILLIDDRVLERECLVYRMSVAGFRTVATANTKSWSNILKDHSFGLILYYRGQSFDDHHHDLVDMISKAGETPTMILSPTDDYDYVVKAITLGARGYISSGACADHLIAAIRYVIAGGVFIPATSVLASCNGNATSLSDQSWKRNFTTKQAAVIECIRRGKPNKIIAYELNMCESTVKVHVRNIMKKLKARNRTELAFKATEAITINSNRDHFNVEVVR